MKQIGFLLALSTMLSTPLLAQNQQGICEGVHFSGVNSHDCLRGVYLTTSIANGDCEDGCPYTFNLRYQVQPFCGGGWGGDRLVGYLACGSIFEYDYDFMGTTIAWANYTCFECFIIEDQDGAD